MLLHSFLDLSRFLKGALLLCLLHLLIKSLLFANLMKQHSGLLLRCYHFLMILPHFLQIFLDCIFPLFQLNHPLFLTTSFLSFHFFQPHFFLQLFTFLLNLFSFLVIFFHIFYESAVFSVGKHSFATILLFFSLFIFIVTVQFAIDLIS